ncbi:DUF2199 domain-containing protein [Hymenobacter swuensis]|uniref:DUF2199 domain-containing protein n=1 Tax=Hymenobacter swuensis TaxID=1446467 RepID=UPI0005C62ABA|nr:DUF2199 domain-containing protein [Hymenobacter swuensis]
MSYQCACCGRTHEELPDIGSAMPYMIHDVSEEERQDRVVLTADMCILDDEHYFIRGVLEIPVHEQEQTLGFGVWVSQKAEHFHAYREQPDSTDIGPFFGWFCTEVNAFSPTILLKSKAHFIGNGQRPSIELEPTDHPLAVAQREGISLARAWEIVHEYLPKE